MDHQTGWIEIPEVSLRLLLPGGRGEYLCTKTHISIGRNPDCDICFRDVSTLSRYHARIVYRGGRWYIEDCRSVNGTFVNDVRLPEGIEHPLQVGDRIRLAANIIIEVLPVHADPERTIAPAAPDWRNSTMGFEPVRAPEAPAAPATFCYNCGSPVNGMFCPRCGSKVGTSAESPFPSTVFYGDEAAYSVALEAPPPSAARSRPEPSICPTAAPGMAPSAPPAKKPGLFGKLFGGKKQEPVKRELFTPPSAPAAPVQPRTPVKPQADDVQFRGAAPQNINPGEYFTVKIMMYREDDYQRADRETAAVAEQVKVSSSGVFQANRGDKFRIVLQSPDVDLEAGDETLTWNGIFAAADFEVFLPENYDRKQLRLRGRVYSGDAVLTDLKLILQVSAAAPQQVVCEKVRLRTAFISYASADRAKVVARLQGILLACPDMDLFFDVESLRRGEAWEPRLYQEIAKRELFYLFWSRNAADSQWVRKELDYAVSQKTVEFIEPIPLERPDICPPPEALMCKHFNDWTLRYLNNN